MYLYSKSVVFGHGRMAHINKYAFLALSGDPFVQFSGKPHADGLHDLNQGHEQDNCYYHDIQLVPVVAVSNRYVSQAASAYGAGHGGISKNGSEGDSESAEQGRTGLEKHDFHYYGRDSCSHALGGFYYSLIYLKQ